MFSLRFLLPTWQESTYGRHLFVIHHSFSNFRDWFDQVEFVDSIDSQQQQSNGLHQKASPNIIEILLAKHSHSYSFGKEWEIPLWQPIQVSPLTSLLFSVCFFRALLSWFVRSIVSKAWQFRHSLESVAFIDVQTFSASSSRLASNFSRVSMVSSALCNSSLLAFIFRTNLCAHGFGSWQSDTRELLANCLKIMAANERQASLDLLCL